MRFLITGGNGFLGRALAQKLLALGHEVRILDLKKGDLGCEYIAGDITEKATVDKAMKGITHVYHVAAIVGFNKDKREFQRHINVDGTRMIMQAALDQQVTKVVYTSTINTLGYVSSENDLGDEETPYNWGPLDISYMETKHEAEQLVLKMVQDQKLPATIVHPGTIFGGGSAATAIFGQASMSPKTATRPVPAMNANRYVDLIRKRQMPTYPTGGTNCVALEDVVDGHIAAMEKGHIGERYILGAENLAYKKLFEFIAKELGVPAPAIPLVEGPTEFLAGVAERGFKLFGSEPPFTAEMVRASSRYSFYKNDKARRELGIQFRAFLPYLSDFIRRGTSA